MSRYALATWAACLLFLGPGAGAVEYPRTSCAASTDLWSAANAIDANNSTCWSGVCHGDSSNTEWYAFCLDGFHDVNYVRLTLRFTTIALGFPRTFTIYWSDGVNWNAIRTVTNMQTPYRNDDIILAFPTTVNCNGIWVTATVLGGDDVGNYVLQMAEFNAGYDQTFKQFVWVGSDSSITSVKVRSVGAGTFNPNKISNWHYDARNPIIAPKSGAYRNIYAPSVVFNGTWNIYFGGWDGTSYGNDEVSITTTNDFLSFSPHYKMISRGVFVHVNNESAVKVTDGNWRMAYTTCDGTINKPGYAISSDGVSWIPSSGSTSYLMTMTGYSNWPNADVNGGNHIYYENGTYHMYFDDFTNAGVHYATSTDNINYVYKGKKISTGIVCNDLKSFVYNGTRYYLWGYHANNDRIYYSIGTSVIAPPAISTLFTNNNSADRYITSVGFVTDGTKLYGALYGAGAVSALNENRIFASWLQRKVLFSNANTTLGSGEQSYGPDTLCLSMASGQGVETGSFGVYDTDGSTFMLSTSNVTLLAGDIWKCAFLLDTTAPNVPGTPTDSGAYTRSTSVTFNWAASTDADSGVAGYNCKIGNSPGGSDAFSGYLGNTLSTTSQNASCASFTFDQTNAK